MTISMHIISDIPISIAYAVFIGMSDVIGTRNDNIGHSTTGRLSDLFRGASHYRTFGRYRSRSGNTRLCDPGLSDVVLVVVL